MALLINPQQPVKKHVPAKYEQNETSNHSKHNTLAAISTTAPIASDTPKPNSQNDKNQSADGRQKIEIVPQPPGWWFKAYVMFTGVIAFLNLGMLIAIWRQRNVMADQLKEMQGATKQTGNMIALMDDTAKRQLRAYVCVSSALLKFTRPDAPEAQLWTKNYGETPAYDVRHWIGMWIGDHPLQYALTEPPENFEMYKAIIPPDGETVMIFPKVPPVPAENVKLLGTVEGTIYVYGKVLYRDAFGIERRLAYRLIYGGKDGIVRDQVRDGIRTGMLKPDTEGNDAD